MYCAVALGHCVVINATADHRACQSHEHWPEISGAIIVVPEMSGAILLSGSHRNVSASRLCRGVSRVRRAHPSHRLGLGSGMGGGGALG